MPPKPATPSRSGQRCRHRRVRTGFVEERTALVNRMRGLLAEFGVFVPQGIDHLRKHFVDRVEDGNYELAGPARHALMHGWAQWQALDDEIAWFDRQIAEHASQDPLNEWSPAARLLSGPGRATTAPSKAVYWCAVCLAAVLVPCGLDLTMQELNESPTKPSSQKRGGLIGWCGFPS